MTAEDRDYWQEYKDDLAMGRIYPDGSQREPEPDDEWPPLPGPDSLGAFTAGPPSD